MVPQPVHGYSPNSVVHTSCLIAGTGLVIVICLTDDLDPRLMNMLLFTSWHSPKQMMKTSVFAVMQAACLACSKIDMCTGLFLCRLKVIDFLP